MKIMFGCAAETSTRGGHASRQAVKRRMRMAGFLGV
jgi:hypothetical protein